MEYWLNKTQSVARHEAFSPNSHMHLFELAKLIYLMILMEIYFALYTSGT